MENLLLIYLRQDFTNTSNLLLGTTVATMSAFEVAYPRVAVPVIWYPKDPFVLKTQ